LYVKVHNYFSVVCYNKIIVVAMRLNLCKYWISVDNSLQRKWIALNVRRAMKKFVATVYRPTAMKNKLNSTAA